MTDKLAKDICESLIDEIRRNGYSDIFTFLLPETDKKRQFEEFTASYIHKTTDSAMYDLIIHTETHPQIALRNLIGAAKDYFLRVQAISSRYSNEINSLGSTAFAKIGGEIRIEGPNNDQINITNILALPAVEQFLRLLSFLTENQALEDQAFLERLEQFLTQTT